jgi:hypothetical protein
MVTATESLWGAFPEPKNRIRTPKHIFREQAQILSDLCNHLLLGEVVADAAKGKIIVSLYVVAPTLNNYRVLIARAYHDATGYPVTLEDPLESVPTVVRAESYDDETDEIIDVEVPGSGPGKRECQNESEFREALSRILKSEKVHRVVSTLLSQVEEE